MSQRDKLVEKIRKRPVEARYSDVERLLVHFDWTKRSGTSSKHVVFTKKGESRIVVPKVGGKMVKRVYLDQICERLGLDD